MDKILEKNGTYHIGGIGKGLATSILMDLDPQKYATWNNKTNSGLEALGSSPQFAWEIVGGKIDKVMDVIRHIREFMPKLNFLELDHFFHIVSATDDGIKAVEKLMEEEEQPQ